MRKRQEVVDAMQAVVGDIEGLTAQAKTADLPADKRATIEGALKDKNDEFARLKAEIEQVDAEEQRQAREVEAMQAKRQLLEGLRASRQIVPAGDAVVAAQAKDEDRIEGAKVAAFGRLLSVGAALSDRERDLLKPESGAWKKATGVAIPKSLAAKFMPGLFAKTRPDLYAKVMTADTASGAALIPLAYRPELLQLPGEPAFLLERVTVVPAVNGQMRWPRLVQSDSNEYGGVVFQWLDEAHEKPETEPVFEDITIHCHECAGYTELSHTLIRRSALDVEGILRTLYSDAAQDTIDNVIIAGSGVGQPTGIINTAGIRLVTRHAAGAVDYSDLVHLKHAVRPFHRRSAVYVEGDDVDQGLELTTDLVGRPLYNASMANGPYDRLVGYPYYVTVRTPALGTAGDIIYGNPAMYTLCVEQEVLIDSSDHFKFRENKRAYRLFFSIGGIAALPRAFAILGEEES